MKAVSSKRAKACQISGKTKRLVYERDDGLCVVCGQPGLPEAHYIPRSKGGLGIEQNVVCLCRRCHDRFDQGTGDVTNVIGERIRSYLQSQYDGWTEDDLVYKKYGGNINGM